MICLDTNYLVRGLVKGSKESTDLVQWYQSNELLMSAAPAWYEFLCGPVASRHIQIVRGFLAGGVISFEEVQAIEAARLFNAVGRTRRLRTDAMIAATAIVAGARLATSNAEDFKAFVPHGLTIVQ
ncbi:MAG: type II toxin-antitoxin system VapC family toxin [Verrucomicrobia bacterium]|nr:type II toxin-antitoxin system VapC family toxin [Verrucomicrobiota bacterium]